MKPRILFTMMDYTPSLVGGSIVFMDHLLNHLPSENVCLMVCSFPGQQKDVAQFDYEHLFKTIRLPFRFSYYSPISKGQKLRLLWAWLIAFWKHTRHSTTDIVVVENIYYMGLFSRLISQLRGIPYIVTCYGEELSMVLHSSNSPSNWVRKTIYKLGLQGAAALITISYRTSDLAGKFGVSPDCIIQIYPPTPIPKQLPSKQAVEAFHRAHQLEGKRILASVGRLIRRKGHDRLLEAMPQVITRFPDVTLVIASTGEMENELKRLAAKLNLIEHIRFLGQVDRSTLDLLYASCELFVMPNRTLPNGDLEGYGMVFNEANAFGKAVIGGRSGGTLDAIIHEHTGLLVDGDNVDEIAAAIVRLLDNPDYCCQLGKNGYEWVQSERSTEKAAEQLWNLACRIIGPKYNPNAVDL